MRKSNSYDDTFNQYGGYDDYSDDYGDGNRDTAGFDFDDDNSTATNDDILDIDDEEIEDFDDDDDEEEISEEEKAANAAFLLNSTDAIFQKGRWEEEGKVFFKKMVEYAKADDKEVRKKGYAGALQELDRFILNRIHRKYKSYIEHDKEFENDLLQAGRLGVIKALHRYDPDKSMPTTFFTHPINHELYELATETKHHTKAHMATTKKKIQQIDAEFAKRGLVPYMNDYVYILRLPWKRIDAAKKELNMKTPGSLNEEDAPQIADPRSVARGTEEEAMSSMNANHILKIAAKLEKDEVIVKCLEEQSVNGVPLEELAKKYGRPKESIADGIKNLINLLRYDGSMRKMYPHIDRRETEFEESIITMPVKRGSELQAELLASLADRSAEDLEAENKAMRFLEFEE